jgi:hypothetical protein
MRANGKNMNHADNADEKKKKNTDEKDDAEKLKQKSAYDIAKLYRFADRIDIQARHFFV